MCSDVVYEPAAYRPLLLTLMRLAALGVASRTVMAHRSRHPDEHLFWTAAARRFRLRLLRGAPFVPLGSPAGTAALLPPGCGSGTAAAEHGRGAEVRLVELEPIPGAPPLGEELWGLTET